MFSCLIFFLYGNRCLGRNLLTGWFMMHFCLIYRSTFRFMKQIPYALISGNLSKKQTARSTVVQKLQFTQILIDSHAFRDMSRSETDAYRVQVQLEFPQDLEGRDEKMFVADTEDQSLNKVVSQCRYHSLCPNRRFLHLCSGVYYFTVSTLSVAFDSE